MTPDLDDKTSISVTKEHSADNLNATSDGDVALPYASVGVLALSDPLGHLQRELTTISSKVDHLESQVTKRVSDELKSFVPSLVTNTLKEQLVGLLSDALKDTLPQLIKESIKSSNSEYITEELPQVEATEVFKKENAEGEKWEKKIQRHQRILRYNKLIFRGSKEDDSDEDDLDKQPLSKRFKIMPPILDIPNPIPLNTFVPEHLLKLKENKSLFKNSPISYLEPLPQISHQLLSENQHLPEFPPKAKKLPLYKNKGMSLFDQEEGEFNNQIKEIKRLSDLKAKKEKSKQELRKMFNQATLKAQVQKWTEHEEKKVKMMEEYNHMISFRADQLPITKISYVFNPNKEGTMKITRGDNTLNLIVHPNFKLRTLGFSEWLEVQALASKKTRKSNDMLLQSLRAKFQWVINQAMKLGLLPPPTLATFRMTDEDKKRKRTEFLKEVFLTENITVDRMHMNLIPPPRVVPIEDLVINEPESRIFFMNGNTDIAFQRDMDSVVMKGLSECKASESNIERIRVKDIFKEVKDYLTTYLSAGMNISWRETQYLLKARQKAFAPLSNLPTRPLILSAGYITSGLKININKSKLIGIGVSSIEVDNAAKKVGCATLTAPFHYLGVKFGGSMSRKSLLTEVICMLSSRLSKWKLKTLSVGGRLTLIKSVLIAIQLYHMSMFKVPKCVSNKMEALRRNIFNGVEGSGSKTSFRFFLLLRRKALISWLSLRRRLFALESRKDISVAEKMSHPSLAFSFRRLPRGDVEDEQFSNLISCTLALILPQIEDRWVWSLSSIGDFSVNSARSFIDDKLLPSFDSPTRRVKVILIKINIFTWRVWQDKLPTRLNISLRCIEIPTILCSSCNTSVESASLLFFSSLGASSLE
nr:RNA-directed DNA polymerase, eukaryota, reverse transcriptase zinc-binding domain protein [Tanacetum cinerariifolium]